MDKNTVYRPLIEQKFNGLKVGCDCRNHSGQITSTANLRQPNGFLDETCSYQEKVSGCDPTQEQRPKQLTVFNGKIICKKVLPYEYNNIGMDRIFNDSGKCPNGTRSCSQQDDRYHQKCVPFDRMCVINDIKFVESSGLEVKDKISNDTEEEWQYIKFNDSMAIGISTS